MHPTALCAKTVQCPARITETECLGKDKPRGLGTRGVGCPKKHPPYSIHPYLPVKRNEYIREKLRICPVVILAQEAWDRFIQPIPVSNKPFCTGLTHWPKIRHVSMPDIIQLLPDSIANQIAAGEVVQRPASIVKELMENSIDAGATSIQLLVKEAGKTLVQIIDDGSGMSETDARLSIERHATSKIRRAEDLFTLRTMGFRGEALASIAAVAQVEIKTRLSSHELGTALYIEASEVKRQEAIACEKGTSISVKNLFYNIPARRNFLKSNANELNHITDEFQRLALSHPDISFSFYNNDINVHDLPSAKLSQRIVALFGKNYQAQLTPCKEETDLVKIHGYVGKPESAKKARGEQYLFVNNRFIRSPYLHHAVMSSFEGIIPDNHHPFYVLFIEIDPKHIDVNVHPTKTEIKFDNEQSVYAVVRSAVRQAIGAHNLIPSIDFSGDVNLVEKLNAHQGGNPAQTYYDERFGTPFLKPNTGGWEKLFEGENPNRMVTPIETSVAQAFPLDKPGVQGLAGDESLFQIHNRYIFKQVQTGVLIVDQEAAHERILFEKFMSQIKRKSGESQQVLFPQSITFQPQDFALLSELGPEIHSLGFQYEIFGKNTLLLQGIPAGAGEGNRLLESVIEQFKMNQQALSLPVSENLSRSLARRAGIKAGKKLEKGEMRGIVDQLFACSTPNYAPDGKPTFYIFELSKIERYFTRL